MSIGFYYTLKGKRIPRVGLKPIIIKVLTREQTGKFNFKHYKGVSYGFS